MTITDSKGQTRTTQYRYPSDITNSPDAAILKTMTQKNIISDYIEKTVSIDNMIVSGEYQKFNEMQPSGVIKPEKIDLLQLSSPLAYKTLYPTTNASMQGNSNLYPETYYKYDVKGNVVETKHIKNNYVDVILWGYNYQYPIAEIKNATYSDVIGIIPESTLNAIAAKSELSAADSTTINSLRNSLPNALVATYYDYDAFGRLKETYYYENNDKSKKRKVEAYDYHYKSE